MNLTTALARLLIFPGILFAVPLAWFFLWVERKAVALMQGRIGPPFMQPFYDFIKLLGKGTPPRTGVAGALMKRVAAHCGFIRGRRRRAAAGAAHPAGFRRLDSSAGAA